MSVSRASATALTIPLYAVSGSRLALTAEPKAARRVNRSARSRKRLALAGEGQLAGDPVGHDQHHRVAVALVERRRVLPALELRTPITVSPARSGTLTSLRTSGLAARYSGRHGRQ